MIGVSSTCIASQTSMKGWLYEIYFHYMVNIRYYIITFVFMANSADSDETPQIANARFGIIRVNTGWGEENVSLPHTE